MVRRPKIPLNVLLTASKRRKCELGKQSESDANETNQHFEKEQAQPSKKGKREREGRWFGFDDSDIETLDTKNKNSWTLSLNHQTNLLSNGPTAKAGIVRSNQVTIGTAAWRGFSWTREMQVKRVAALKLRHTAGHVGGSWASNVLT